MSSLPTDFQPQPASDPAQFRSQMGQISRHSAVFFAGILFTALAGYLFKVFLARVLGAEALGFYALGMTIIGFVGIFNDLGIPQAAVRFVALYTAAGKMSELRNFFARGLIYLGLTNAVLGSVVVLFGPWMAERLYRAPELKNYMPLFALIMIGGAFTGFFGFALQGYKDVSRRTVITNFVGTPLMMLMTVVLIRMGYGLWGYIFAQVLSAGVVIALLAWAVWRLTPPAARHLGGPLIALESQVMAFSAAAFGIGLLEFLLAQVDKILIGVFINAREVGIYAVAASIVAFVPIALQSVNQIFSPTIADLHTRGQRELLGRLFQTLTKWILGFTLPLATIVIVFARPIMRIFGPEFEAGWIVLVVGTLGQLVNCGTGSVGYLLLMSGKQGRLIRVQTVMAVLMILTNLLLIPRFGILGAAVAAALTTIATNAWNLFEVRKSLGLSPYNRSYGNLLIPTVVVMGMAELVRRYASFGHLGWLYILLAIAGAYVIFAGLALSFGLGSDDRLILGAIYSKLRGLTGSAL
jgi:O-antigen/teichoic acid export membrane protein